MRIPFLLLALLAAGAISLAPRAGLAQATLDRRALDPLSPPSATKEAPARPVRPPVHAPATAAHPPAAPKPSAATLPPPAPPQVRVPLVAPPPPELPPALAVPMRPPAPPAPAPVVADAPGAADPLPDGVRITFGGGTADLNPATDAALKGLAHGAPADAHFNVTAFAPGAPEDPSTPRRTALARALAVRSVLIAEGVPSDRIYARALGATGEIGDGPPDRADVTVIATNPQARSSK